MGDHPRRRVETLPILLNQPHVTHSMGAWAKFKLQFDVLHLQAVRIHMVGGWVRVSKLRRRKQANGTQRGNSCLLTFDEAIYTNVCIYQRLVVLSRKANTKLLIFNNKCRYMSTSIRDTEFRIIKGIALYKAILLI